MIIIKILLTNDDGIFAEGINALAKELSKNHRVFVVAPSEERSATGHAITIHHPLRVQEYNYFADNIRAWSVSGTPADCVKLGLEAVLDEKPDVIISGINDGPNLGTDVLYSGTVSAAMEGAIHNVKSIAMSMLLCLHYDTAAKCANQILEFINDESLKDIMLYNVNVPNMKLEDIKGIRSTKLGIRRYENSFDKRFDPRGKVYYWMAGRVIEEEQDIDSDIVRMKEGYISVTPMQYDMTNNKMYEILKEKLNK